MNRSHTIEPLELEDIAELLAMEARGESLGPSFELGVPTFEKMAPSNGPPDMKLVEELFATDPPAELFSLSRNTRLHTSATGKWSSLTVAVLIHCFLLATFLFGASSQPPSRNDCIQVQLMASSGGSEVKGGGGSKPFLKAGGERAPKAVPRCPPVAKRGAALLPVPKKDIALKKRPVHPARIVRKARQAPVRKPARNKKLARARPLRPENKSALRPQSAKAAKNTASGAPDSAHAVHGADPAPAPGAGPSQCRAPAGGGKHGPRSGGGVMEVGFGSPNGPRFLHWVAPSYPEFAQEQQIQGTVLLRLIIDKHGRVVNVEVLKKAGFGFDRAAVKAIRESTFIPAKNKGKSCRCIVLLPIRFQLQ